MSAQPPGGATITDAIAVDMKKDVKSNDGDAFHDDEVVFDDTAWAAVHDDDDDDDEKKLKANPYEGMSDLDLMVALGKKARKNMMDAKDIDKLTWTPATFKLLDGGSFVMSFPQQWTFGEMKECLTELLDMPVSKIRLVIRGAPVNDAEEFGVWCPKNDDKSNGCEPAIVIHVIHQITGS